MTLIEAMDVRRSRRKYLPAPIEDAKAELLRASVAGLNAASGLHMQLVLNNGDAFRDIRTNYGALVGVRNYLALIGPDDTLLKEKCGYYGELLVLEATALGLGTCWVAANFTKSKCVCDIAPGEAHSCVIAVGYAPETATVREKLIRKYVDSKTKSIEEMYTADGEVPDWFLRGMEAAAKAPSAVNRKPVRFRYKGGGVSADVPEKSVYTDIDLGIAKQHFRLGAGFGAWQWGDGGAFIR